jgi:hypothetical protein
MTNEVDQELRVVLVRGIKDVLKWETGQEPWDDGRMWVKWKREGGLLALFGFEFGCRFTIVNKIVLVKEFN